MNNDAASPECPCCGLALKKGLQKIRVGTNPSDWDWIENITYYCVVPTCGRVYIDKMDGSALQRLLEKAR